MQTTQELVQALYDGGLTTTEIAVAVGVGAAAVDRWKAGTAIPQGNATREKLERLLKRRQRARLRRLEEA